MTNQNFFHMVKKIGKIMNPIKIVGLSKQIKEMEAIDYEKRVLENKIARSCLKMLRQLEKQLKLANIKLTLLDTKGKEIALKSTLIFYAKLKIEDENKTWIEIDLFLTDPKLIKKTIDTINEDLLNYVNTKEQVVKLEENLKKKKTLNIIEAKKKI